MAIASIAALAIPAMPADAGVIGRNRFHVVNRRIRPRVDRRVRRGKPPPRSFRQRLRPETQRALRSIGVFHQRGTRVGDGAWATAFLVHRAPDGTGLVLTNEHVVRGLGTGEVTFGHEGRRPIRATGVKVIARDATLDYALVQVKLPRGTRLPVLELSAAPVAGRVYSAGFDDLGSVPGDPDLSAFDWSTRDRRELPDLATRGPVQSIQTGNVLFGGRRTRVRGMNDPSGNWIDRTVSRVSVDLGGIGGGSGRPILSVDSHKVVAIHSSSGAVSRRRDEVDLSTPAGAADAGASLVVPVRDIVTDLARRLERGSIKGSARSAVEELVRSARAAAR